MQSYTTLPFIEKIPKSQQQAFGDKLISISQDMGMLPEWLMIVMNNESGLNPAAKNPYGTASGLIQFTEPTAYDLGTTTAALRAMSATDQLDYVKKFFTKYGYNKKINSVADTYLAVFFPLALTKSEDYIFPQWATDANPVFDTNKDHVLTKKEFTDYVNNKYAAYIPKSSEDELLRKKKIKTIIIVSAIIIVVVIACFWFYNKYKK